jgi:NADH dehydrogenase FAD-containing subunit
MYIYMGHMRYQDTKPYEDWFWEKNRIKLVKDHVTSIDVNSKQLSLQTGSAVRYDKLVIATGSNQTNHLSKVLI